MGEIPYRVRFADGSEADVPGSTLVCARPHDLPASGRYLFAPGDYRDCGVQERAVNDHSVRLTYTNEFAAPRVAHQPVFALEDAGAPGFPPERDMLVCIGNGEAWKPARLVRPFPRSAD